MAGTDRTSTGALALLQRLQSEPFRFGFFQAVRRLECAFRDRPRLGQSLHAAEDAVRFAQEPSLEFAPSTLAACHPGTGGQPPRLAVNFLGLFGPNGPLPLHLTEFARDRIHHHDDPTLARFLDIFHHRMLSLFYRAWADTQPTVSYDRPESDRFAVYIASLFGLGMSALRDRDALPDLVKLHYAGRLACQTKNAEGLGAMLADYLGMPVGIEELVGHWLRLPVDLHYRLGGSAQTCALGQSATLGVRVWDCQYKFRVIVGPVGLAEYRSLLPGGKLLGQVAALVRGYVGQEYDWDLKLILRKDEVPPMALGKTQLGWTARTLKGKPRCDVDDLLVRVSSNVKAG